MGIIRRILSLFKGSILKVAGSAIQDAVAAYSNPFLVLIRVIVQEVFRTEASNGGTGAEKVEKTMQGIMIRLEEIIEAFAATGKSVTNATLFTSGVNKIMEGAVDILNASGNGAKPETP